MGKQRGKHFTEKSKKEKKAKKKEKVEKIEKVEEVQKIEEPKEPKKPKKESKHKWLKRFFILIILVIIGTFGYFYVTDKEFVIETGKEVIEKIRNVFNQDTGKSIAEGEVSKLPDVMGEYKVLGVLVIDKLGIQKSILDRTTDESLNLSVTKFYGPNLNEKGNFCITGHNYEDVFAYVEDLEINDTFYIIDKANGKKVTYKIYKKYTVNPTDLECLNQETNDKKEVTLITCNPGGTTRLIVKAQEV